jgi:hypothetical protein
MKNSSFDALNFDASYFYVFIIPWITRYVKRVWEIFFARGTFDQKG